MEANSSWGWKDCLNVRPPEIKLYEDLSNILQLCGHRQIDQLVLNAKLETGIAFIYFSYQNQASQTPAEVVRNLIKQLLCCVPVQSYPQTVQKWFETKEVPALPALEALLHVVSEQFSRVIFIFDALDECDERRQRVDLNRIIYMLGRGNGKVFVTSRPSYGDIAQVFRDATKLELKAKEADIAPYIRTKLSGMKVDFVEDVVTKLWSFSDGQ